MAKMLKTKSGFEFKIIDGVEDDYEVFETICELNAGNAFVLPDLGKRLLGDKCYSALKEHCKTDGKVSTKMLMHELKEILTVDKAVKN